MWNESFYKIQARHSVGHTYILEIRNSNMFTNNRLCINVVTPLHVELAPPTFALLSIFGFFGKAKVYGTYICLCDNNS
jgi:hypothetical protein